MPDVPPIPEPPDIPDYKAEFLKSIRAIEKSSRLLTELVPQQTAELSKQLHATYKTGPSEPLVIDHGPSGQRSQHSATPDDNVPATEKTLRELLTLQRSGGPGVEGKSQQTATQNKGWRSRATAGIDEESLGWLHLPGGQLTAYDILGSISTTLANYGVHKEKANAPAVDALREQMKAAGTYYDEDGNVTPEATQQLEEKGSTTGSRLLGKASDLATTAQKSWVYGQQVRALAHKVSKPFTGANAYAYETGYQGGSPTILGMRSPFSGATWAGFGQKASEMEFALGNNITPGQAHLIYNNLFNQGWFGGGSTNAMRSAAASEMRTNPMIGSMPQYYEMMDKATRFGATSLDQFNAIMKQVPEAAKSAHVGIGDMISQMQDLGTQNTQMGGTFQGGLANAQTWASTTGMPPSVMGQLMQNPLVVGQTYAATGIMPQMQGLLSPSQHMQGMFGAINMLSKAIVPPGSKSFKDPITGLSQTIGSQDQKEALMSTILGIPKDQVHTLLANQTGMMRGAEIWNAASTYHGAVMGDVRAGHLGQAFHDLTSGYTGIDRAMQQATDSQGHKIFEDWTTFKDLRGKYGDKRAHALAQRQARIDVANAGDHDVLQAAGKGDIQSGMHHLGLHPFGGSYHMLSGSQRADLAQYVLKHGHLTGGTMARVSADRQKEIQKYINQNTQKFGSSNQQNNGPSLQIELGPAAKKHFNLNDPNNQQKASRNAGSASVDLSSYINNYTQAPYSNLDTAGGGSTYHYGGAADASTPGQ